MGALEDLRRKARVDRAGSGIAGPLVRFAIVGLAVLMVGAALVGFVAWQVGAAEAVDSARQQTSATAQAIVEPRLSGGVVSGQWSALSAFDNAIRQYVLKDGLVRVNRVVTDAGGAVLHRLAGPSIGALLAIELALIPVAWLVLRRNRYQQHEWERLRQHAAQARDLERRRLAGELHDGVVQDLAGINYALERLRLGGGSADQRDEVIADSASRLRGSIGTLRTLLTESYPPDLSEQGLGFALAELAEGLERAGMDVQLEMPEAEHLPPAASALIFRAAQEAVRNVATHSGARGVLIRAGQRDGQATLVVEDDGRGFDEARLRERISAGHFGLRSTGDLVAASGGMLRVRAAPGRGTRVTVEVPVG